MPDDSQPTLGHSDYVVVARRYRPQGFDELIGQQHVAQALKRAISSDRVGHAYLFTGARGVGKTSAARILAKALNCIQGPTPQPCNTCDICQAIAGGDDVDVLEIDGASNRGIDEIRQLRQNVAVRPSRARLKIYIIDEVHMLTKEAFNALLKTLEEPPEHVKFIFATTEPNKIPITILSRCQRFDFAGIDQADIQARLAQIAEAEGVTVEPDALQILAVRAAGSMRDSQSLLEQLLSGGGTTITSADVTQMLGIAPAARLSQLVQPLVNQDAATALTELAAALAEGADVSQLLDQLLGYFRDVMALAVGCQESLVMYVLPSQYAEVREIAQRLGVETLLAIVQVLDQAASRMRITTHTRTLAEMTLVRVCNLGNLDAVADLVAQLRDPNAGPAATGEGVKKNVTPRPTGYAGSRSSVGTVAPAGEQQTVVVSQPAVTPTVRLSAENVEQVWKQVLERLTGMVAEHAARVDEVQVDAEGRMVLRFAEAFLRDACERPANRQRLEAAITEVCGQGVGLLLQVSATPQTPRPAAPPAVSRRQQQQEVSNQPFVKRALELFGGDPQRMRYVPPGE